MSALGDYIHLKISNYKKYGTANETGGNTEVTPIFYNYYDSKAFIQERLNRVTEVSDEAVNILRARLKSNTPFSLSQEEQKWYRNQQQWIDYIYELIFTQVENIDEGATKLFKDTSGANTRQLKNITALSQWASSYSYEQLIQLRKQKQKQLEKINNLIREINNGQQPQSDNNLKRLTELYTEFTDIIPNKQFNTVAEIENAIAAFIYGGTIQQVAGTFGEQLVAACDDAAENMGKREFVNFIQNAVKGDEKTQILINKELISENKAPFLNMTKDRTQYSIGTTQNKTDVNINIQDEDIFASVKDYAPKPRRFKNPHLQDVNLFQSLAFLNDYLDNFGNHWLNMHALKGGGKWSNQQSADEIVSREVAYEALSQGSPFKQTNPANVFVYIDRVNGYVFVEKVSDILLNHFERFKMSKIGSINLKNRKVPLKNGIQDRIADILNQVHKINIAVSLNIRPY